MWSTCACLPAGLIQASLGHGSARTTPLYTLLTREVREAAQDPINRLLADF